MAITTRNIPTKEPEILFTDIAYGKISTLVDIAPKEVGWLGSVREEKHKNTILYVIEDIYLFNQVVHDTETKIDNTSLAEFFDKKIDIANTIKFWGHSHVNMGVAPSAQDLSQMEELMGNGAKFFIMGIFNKKKLVRLDVYDEQFIYSNVKWSILSAQLPELMKEYKDKVKEEKKYAKYPTPQYGYQSTESQNTNRSNWGGSQRKQDSNESSKIGLRKSKNLGRRHSGRTQHSEPTIPSQGYIFDEDGRIIENDEDIWNQYDM